MGTVLVFHSFRETNDTKEPSLRVIFRYYLKEVKEVNISGRLRIWRKVFLCLAGLFVLTVAIQVFLAGFATFIDPVKWHSHVVFVRIIEFLPIIMLIISFIGKLPTIVRWQSLGLFILIMLMYATANIPNAGAFHPVIALIMFWLSTVVVQKAWQSIYETEEILKDTTDFKSSN